MRNGIQIDCELEDKIQGLRKNLLDISNKNKLINFRHNNRSRRLIRIVDEVPSQIYDCLAREEKGMKLKPLLGFDEPVDERTVAFKNQLEVELKNAGIGKEEDFETEEEFRKKDREIRNIVRQKLGLKPIPEQKDINALAQFYGVNPDYDLPTQSKEKKHNDLSLQTLYSITDLNKRLLTVHNEAKTNEKDKGINTLYLIFGFLEWRESPTSTTKIISPLTLLPVSMECKTTNRGASYRINATGRLIINKCLDLKLNDSFKMKLPELVLNDEGILVDSIEDYFQNIEKIIEKNPKWKFRRFVSLTNLDFNKVVIYEDLDPKKWGKSPLSCSFPIRHVFWGDDRKSAEDTSSNSKIKDFDIDEEAINDHLNDLLIKEADSSQHAAILDAMNGNNIVVSGPPGTGKSQTITNLIAQALGRGKKVLFMCEKLAALRVVKNRLDHCKTISSSTTKDTSLGDFCFELHSNTSKKAIHSVMAKRLEIPNYPIVDSNHQQNIRNINKKRQLLRNLSATLSKNIGNSGKNYVQAVWEREKLREKFCPKDEIDSFFWDTDVGHYSADKIAEFVEHICLYAQQYSQIQTVFPDLLKHPWRWVKSSTLSQISQRGIVLKLKEITEAIKENIKTVSDICNILCVKSTPTSKIFDDINLILDTQMPDIDKKIIRRFESPEYLTKILSETISYEEYIKTISEIEKYSDAVNNLKDIIENHNINDILTNIQAFESPMPNDTLVDIENEYANIEQCIKNLGLLLKLSKKFPSIFMAEEKEFSIIGIQNVVYTVKQLRNFDEKYLKFIFSEYHNEDNKKQAWNELFTESLVIENKLKNFDYQLSIQNLLISNSIIQSAVELEKNASFFKWLFSKEAKIAKRAISEVCPNFKNLPKTDKLLTAKKVAELKQEINSFAQNPDILKINPEILFTSEGTSILRDYDDVIRAVWGIIASNPNCQTTIFKLLEMPLSDFSELVNTLSDPNTLKAMTILYENGSINSDKNLSVLEREFSQRSKYLKTIITLSKSIYLKENIPVSRINDLKDLCVVADEKYSHLNELLEFISLFNNKTKEIIDGITNYLHIIDDITSDSTLRINLLDKRFYEDFTKNLSNFSKRYREVLLNLKDLILNLFELAEGVPEFLSAQDIPLEFFSTNTISEIEYILSHTNLLSEYCDLNEIKNTIKKDGTWEIINKAQEKRIQPEKFEDVFKIAYLYTLLDQTSIDGIRRVAEIENVRNEFKQLDSTLYKENTQYIANMLVRTDLKKGVHIGSTKGYTELSLVEHEASKKQAHIPIREYMTRALDTILALKPCFMMSPQTVSQYLPRKGELFDLLIIDEASQMLPADAIAAMARSKQVVIVGDKQQLPPTNFFSSNLSDSDEDIEDGESILDIADSKLKHRRMLTWHYRAKHESLINFSNKNFYDDKLIVFPSSDGCSSSYGIKFHYVNGTYENGMNEEEADALISSLPDIIKKHKNKSIGIVAINQKQAELLREKFDILISENSEVASYVQHWEDNLEEFFIKNLENVQGDERDIIIISFVYGQTIEKKGVSGNFGPINRQNGYRRLNVLFSRAKEEIYVFTSMLYDQIKTNTEGLPSSNGPIALKNYLYYAANGGIDKDEESHKSPENDFEASVGKFLENNGFNVRYQIGSIGYFIDIVIDSQIGKHIIGIECDGSQYHSSKSARDRDKLRQEQLENLGWKIYRVWSTDWFYNRELAQQRLLKAVNDAFQNQLSL